MVNVCCVEGCDNKWGLTIAGKKVSFFRFPRASGKFGNIKKREEWLAAINRENWSPQPDDLVCGVHFLTGQPNTDPKHPDYRPQIFPNREVDMEKLQGDLEKWEKMRDKNPPVIIQENDIHKPQLILPKGFPYTLQAPIVISSQQLPLIAQQGAVTSLVGTQQVIMTTQQLVNAAASNGTNIAGIPSASSLFIKPLLDSSQENTESTSDTSNVSKDSGSSKSDDALMASLGCKPLNDTDSENLASDKKDEASSKKEHVNENTQNFMNSLSLKPSEMEQGKSSGSVKLKPKAKNQKLSNGVSTANVVNGLDINTGSDIKIEPLDMTLSPTSISAAALMSQLANTALGKSVGTTADMPEFIGFDHQSPKKGGKQKPMKSEEIDDEVISKAVIKTPVKIRNDGEGEEPVRFSTQYMCRYCAQRFDNWAKIKEHVALHLKGKHTNHTCSVCGKEYRTPSKLQRHVRVHSGERPYACTVCGRRFTRSDHVKQHMKVHLPPQELNICRLCGTRFMKRQSLTLHLQQAHLVNQLFTCNRCGEAFESLEQLNAHNLTHDAILNSMSGDGKSAETPTVQGIAKFSVGPAIKQVDGSKLFRKIDGRRPIAPKPEPAVTKLEPKPEPIQSEGTMKYNYVLTLDAPENQEDVTKISDKLITESIEEESKKYEELQKQIEEHARMMAEEAQKRVEALERERKERELAENADAEKIVAAFNIEKNTDADSDNEGGLIMDVDDEENPSVLTSEDGMSMYISNTDILKLKEMNEESNNSDGSDSNANEMEDHSENNVENMETDKEQNDLNKEINKDTDSKKSGLKKKSPYKPGPLWFKTAQEIHRNAVLNKQSEKILNIKGDSSTEDPVAGDKMITCIKPNINELLKAKVEQKNLNIVENDKNVAVSSPVVAIAPRQPMHVPIAPHQQVQQYILVQPPPQQTVTPVTPQTLQNSGMLKCEHCCIWFEDRAMALLHNTLHNADKTDPFTCRKCYKKMGNRLEFMAHLIWHLEPNMDM